MNTLEQLKQERLERTEASFKTGRKAKLLEALTEACIRVYENIDNQEVENDVMQGVARVNVKSAY